MHTEGKFPRKNLQKVAVIPLYLKTFMWLFQNFYVVSMVSLWEILFKSSNYFSNLRCILWISPRFGILNKVNFPKNYTRYSIFYRVSLVEVLLSSNFDEIYRVLAASFVREHFTPLSCHLNTLFHQNLRPI